MRTIRVFAAQLLLFLQTNRDSLASLARVRESTCSNCQTDNVFVTGESRLEPNFDVGAPAQTVQPVLTCFADLLHIDALVHLGSGL